MSEKQEKRKRFNYRFQYVLAMNDWMRKEPPVWKIFARRRWKKSMPVWEEKE